MDKRPNVFGIRHLSPAGACFVRDFLDQVKPELVLIEGPADFTALLEDLCGPQVKPPVAIMAYTSELPVRTILYPLAVYSPEYQAALWAREHQCPCRFCDLPSGIFLGNTGREKDTGESDDSLYRQLDACSEDEDHETFWERTLEQAADWHSYQRGTEEFGRSLRELTSENTGDAAENRVREAYMRRQIREAVEQGTDPERIAVITGAFHREGILHGGPPMTEEELAGLPKTETRRTLMPYSYYRLSQHSGYGAGNRAPAYYELLWQGLLRNEPDFTAYRYLAGLAESQRKHGNPVSSAEVIEAVKLSCALAGLKGGGSPCLKDLRDGAVTCMGHGHFSEIALAAADVEIGTGIGSLPEGISQTSVQTDFNHQLRELRLEKYKSVAVSDISLDLREKLRVQSVRAAFLDLERSFFLHRLRILGISFGTLKKKAQDYATWAEDWALRWTPETEIQIVETVLKGDTIELAAAFELKERVEKAAGIAQVAAVIQDAFCCGMPSALTYAVGVLQKLAVDAAAVAELAGTAGSLSVVIRYGDIRKLDRSPLEPILSQMFVRACLILPGECVCDDQAAGLLAEALITLNEVAVSHEFIENEIWERTLREIADRDDLNTKLSGLSASILLERGDMNSEELGRHVEFRLSKGIPAELGAGWFEGLSMKNHYSLIARLTLWEKLSGYMDSLEDEEFKRALVFLRRAFADFTSLEKDQIAENLGEVWQVNPAQVSEVLNSPLDEALHETLNQALSEPLSEEAADFLEGLEDFDFGDI